MAESVKLIVTVDKSQLTALQTEVKNLGGQTIKFNVDASGVKALQSGLQSISRITKDGNLTAEVTKLNNGLGQTISTMTRYGKAGDTVTETVTQDFFKQKKAVDAQSTAIYNATVSYEKYAKTQADAASKIITPMQAQINAVTGVSNGFKSAEASANVFRMNGLTPLEKEFRKNEKAMDDLSGKSESLLSNIAKFTRWYLIGNAVSGVVRAIREAIDTMKDVDSELVTVRKVTDMTAEELAVLRDRAYEVAGAYGVTADAYLSSVSAFARAGYREQSADLAELAVKTQLVGDVTEETANQFLLSVDKAYQLQGSVEELSRVLDGANELDNKYATSIEKIAEGLGTVAPVAAQMHVSIGELSAAIGTITAVTQRTGSEAARALRALMLNIVGDTKTEIDEGVTWTTGEIAGLRDVIRTYAPEAYKAAQATGSIIDPMEAIGGLAQSMKDGLLTEQQLMEMVSDIGGKLRTSQLLALIQNWDMFLSMMEDFEDAAGSADKEVQNALDSWDRKVNQIKASWTQLVQRTVKTDDIKTALNGIIRILDVLNGKIGGNDFEFSYSPGTLQSWIDGYILRVGAADEATKEFRDNLVENMKGAVDAYLDGVSAGERYSESHRQLIETIMEMLGYYGKYTPAVRENTQAETESAEAAERLAKTQKNAQQAADELERQTKATSAALKDYEALGNLTTDTMEDFKDAFPDVVNALFDEEGALTDAGAAAFDTATKLDSAKAATEYLQLAAQQANYQNLINELNRIKNSAMTASQQIIGMYRALATVGVDPRAVSAAVARGEAENLDDYLNKLAGETETAMGGIVSAHTKTGGKSGSSSSSSKTEKDAELERLNNVVSLRESELEFLEASGASEDERIAKMREIQDALHEQAEYMRSIGAEQADINDLSTKWWKTQKDILDTTEEIAEANRKAFEEYAKSEQDRLEKLRDEEVSVLQTKLDAMESARDAAQDERKEQEKLLAVEKARIALQNAQNERNVRQYNAQTGAWEWVANAQTVQKAQEAFTEAQNALTEFRNDQLYEAQKRAVEQQIAAVKSAYNAQIQAWKDAATAVRNGAGNVADILENGGVQINAAIQKLIEALNLELQMAQQTPHPDVGWNYSTEGAFAEGQNAVNGDKYITDNTGRIYDLDGNWVGDYASGWFPSDYQDVSGSGTSGGGSSGGGTSSTKSISDYSADYNAARSAYLNGTMSAADAAAAMEAANKGANALRGNGSVVTANEDIAKVRNGTLKYDGGGILHGLGGIKATQDDELILPPDLTRTVIRPALDGETAQALDRMRVIYGARPTQTTNIRGGSAIGTQNNGDTFIINGIDLSKHITRGTSIGELADLAGGLPMYYNS